MVTPSVPPPCAPAHRRHLHTWPGPRLHHKGKEMELEPPQPWKAESSQGWSLFRACPRARGNKIPIGRTLAVPGGCLVPRGCVDGEVAWAGGSQHVEGLQILPTEGLGGSPRTSTIHGSKDKRSLLGLDPALSSWRPNREGPPPPPHHRAITMGPVMDGTVGAHTFRSVCTPRGCHATHQRWAQPHGLGGRTAPTIIQHPPMQLSRSAVK